jgi:hypothetical protein
VHFLHSGGTFESSNEIFSGVYLKSTTQVRMILLCVVMMFKFVIHLFVETPKRSLGWFKQCPMQNIVGNLCEKALEPPKDVPREHATF